MVQQGSCCIGVVVSSTLFGANTPSDTGVTIVVGSGVVSSVYVDFPRGVVVVVNDIVRSVHSGCDFITSVGIMVQ